MDHEERSFIIKTDRAKRGRFFSRGSFTNDVRLSVFIRERESSARYHRRMSRPSPSSSSSSLPPLTSLFSKNDPDPTCRNPTRLHKRPVSPFSHREKLETMGSGKRSDYMAEEDRMASFAQIPTSFGHELSACLRCRLVKTYDQVSLSPPPN